MPANGSRPFPMGACRIRPYVTTPSTMALAPRSYASGPCLRRPSRCVATFASPVATSACICDASRWSGRMRTGQTSGRAPTAASPPAAASCARAVRAAASRAVARPDRRAARPGPASRRRCPTAASASSAAARTGRSVDRSISTAGVRLVRLATSGSVGWYKAWARRRMDQPRSGAACSTCSCATRRASATPRGPRDRGGWSTGSPTRCAPTIRGRARRNIEHHYDLGNDFYAAWLDPGMTYSSAIFAEPISADEPLEAAQARKIRLLLDRLELKPGQHLLEIGCGWGGLAEIAARDYGVHVTGADPVGRAEGLCRRRGSPAPGLPTGPRSGSPTIATSRAGSTPSPASRWSRRSGQEYWPAYLQSIARVLKPGGRAGVQLISIRDELFDDYAASADFIQTYVFPGGMLIGEPRFRAIAEARRPRMARPRGLSACIMPKRCSAGARRYDEAVDAGPLPARLRRRLPPALALLSHVLRRRLPRRRHRRRAGDFGEGMTHAIRPEPVEGPGSIAPTSSRCPLSKSALQHLDHRRPPPRPASSASPGPRPERRGRASGWRWRRDRRSRP